MRVMRTYSQTDVEYVKQIEAHKKKQKHNKSFKFLITACLLSQIRKISISKNVDLLSSIQ